MADVKLNVHWDINDEGDFEISVSPEGSDSLILTSFTLGDETVMDALEDDVEEFLQEDQDSIFIEWEQLAYSLSLLSDKITDRIEEVLKPRRDMRLKVIRGGK